jgi:hypothetical protein
LQVRELEKKTKIEGRKKHFQDSKKTAQLLLRGRAPKADLGSWPSSSRPMAFKCFFEAPEFLESSISMLISTAIPLLFFVPQCI